MRASRVRQKFENQQPALISSLCAPIPWFPAYAAHSGYDAVWLDTEHHLWENREIQSYLQLCNAADIDCLIRPSVKEGIALYRYLDNGATGLIVPHVEDTREALKCVAASKFPPVGDRGVDGHGLETDFHLSFPSSYLETANHEHLLCLMLESPKAIDNVEAIAALEGVDILFLGPADLAARLGIPLDFSHPELLTVQKKVSEAAQNAGIAWGCPCPTVEACRDAINLGATFIVHGSDFQLISEGLQSRASDFNALIVGQ